MVTGIRPPGWAKRCGTWPGIWSIARFSGGIDMFHLSKIPRMATGQLSGILRFRARGNQEETPSLEQVD